MMTAVNFSFIRGIHFITQLLKNTEKLDGFICDLYVSRYCYNIHKFRCIINPISCGVHFYIRLSNLDLHPAKKLL